MTRSNLTAIVDQLTGRDIEVLTDVAKFRLLTTKQIQRLHFDPVHPTPLAATRATNRALTRLREAGVIQTLERRIGGVRAGSAGFVWYVGPAGERLLRTLRPTDVSGRHNFREPSRYFVRHTLAVAELAIQATEAARAGRKHPEPFELLNMQTEPASWQQSLSKHGVAQMLKPDLRLTTARGDYEHHWFIEADLATEHLPVIRRQCDAYRAFRATGRYQAAHGLFPAVLWVTPTEARARALRAATAAASGADEALFRICTAENFIRVITAGDDGAGAAR